MIERLNNNLLTANSPATLPFLAAPAELNPSPGWLWGRIAPTKGPVFPSACVSFPSPACAQNPLPSLTRTAVFHFPKDEGKRGRGD